LRFLLVFAGVVVLHATWDGTSDGPAHLIVGGVSFALQLLVAWRLPIIWPRESWRTIWSKAGVCCATAWCPSTT
jgi:hypothetical protein